MRIAFDGRTISREPSGIGVYARSMLSSLLDIDKANEYMVLASSGYRPETLGCELVPVKYNLHDHPMGDLWEQLYLPVYLKRRKVDIFHSPSFHMPFLALGTKRVVNIYDMVSFRFPKTQPRTFVEYSKLMIRMAARAADRIIVSSASTRDELCETFRIGPDRVRVVYGAARDIFRAPVDTARKKEVRERYNLPESFILFVGVVEPRKNLTSLISAYAALKRSGRFAHSLVIFGGKGWLNEHERLLKLIVDEGVSGEVLFAGYCRDEDLPIVYSMAEVFVYPSLYEGFGFPPLEAMSCGCPVVTSNTSSLPEVVGDAGKMVDPHDIDGLAGAILELIENRPLRDEMVRKGIERAGSFSWKRCAEETLKIYGELRT